MHEHMSGIRLHIEGALAVLEVNLLGQENKGVYVLFSGLDIERVIIAALALG